MVRRQIIFNLLGEGAVPQVVVSDPLRSHLGRPKRRAARSESQFSKNPSRVLVKPYRWRRDDAKDLSAARVYSEFDQWLSRMAGVGGSPVLVTCHPSDAAVADRSLWHDVVYYAWDDWLEYPPLAESRGLYKWSYDLIAASDVNVIGVSQAVIEHIGASRSTIVPNGVGDNSYVNLPMPPLWFRDVRRPVAFYAGSLERRLHVEQVRRTAQELSDWTFVLVGPLQEPALFEGLSREPNVLIKPPVPRRQVLAMAATAEVCLIPHRETPMSRAMSPLKLYEYLGAGTPVVATDLQPMRGVSDRCILVPPGESLSAPILKAANLPPQDQGAQRDFLREHSWTSRYARWREAAFRADIHLSAGHWLAAGHGALARADLGMVGPAQSGC